MTGRVAPRGVSSEGGTGCLVLVTGPSGAGKDSLIAAAKTALLSNPRFMFPRRAVTRVRSAHEVHDSLSVAEFSKAVACGAFALH